MNKENVAFALYVTVGVAITVTSVVDIYKTFKRDKPMRDQKNATKKEN